MKIRMVAMDMDGTLAFARWHDIAARGARARGLRGTRHSGDPSQWAQLFQHSHLL